jgi:hypothetical protein
MNTISNRLTRKTINEKQFLGDTLIEIEEIKIQNPKIIPMKKIITNSEYKTNGEILIVIKEVDSCNLTLDSNTTDHIIIKAFTKVYIRPSFGKIDEYYDEIFIDLGACVEFYLLENNWYIVSSDGLKLE